MNNIASEMPWLILELNRQQFAVPARDVRELVGRAEVNAIPGFAAYVRGVMNLRGNIIPVVDLRKRLGMVSSLDEVETFCALMQQREQDHVKWLAELESSLREDREFRLATDPHKCAFGQWYYSYTSDNTWITGLLRRFEQPHARIHATAAEALMMRAQGQVSNALALVKERRQNVLAQMIHLFHSLRDLIRDTQNEIVIVLETSQRRFGIAVDGALALEKFSRDDIEPLPVSTQAAVAQVARKGHDGRPILLLTPEALLGSLAHHQLVDSSPCI
jgi:chemotaxis signal transduction protein